MATTTFSRADVAHILDVPLTAVDHLIENGTLLCRLKKGEPRIPLDVLEAFLRESLIRLYQAEAAHRAPAPPPPAVEEPKKPEPEPEPIIAPAPPPALPIATKPPIEQPQEEERIDLRAAPRYVPRRQIDGIFGETKFTIVQVSRSGLRIRHRDPLLPGDEMKMSFALLSESRSVVLRARVVWTSLAKGTSESFSISGIKVVEHADRLATAIDSLLATHDLEPERRVRERRGNALTLMPDGVTDDEIAAILGAVQTFAHDPVEANRWYSRARFSLSDEKVRREAPQRPRDREEVLGIWEYLDRQVEIAKIVGVVTWMRRNSHALVDAR